MKLTLFFRKFRAGVHSIEELFDTIINVLPDHILHEKLYLPKSNASPKSVLDNLLFAYRSRAPINHITGDAHYIALGTGRNTILTIHDSYSAIQGSFLKKLFIKILWFWLPALVVKRITTISEKSRKELEKILPFAKNKIRVVPNPYNPKLLDFIPIRDIKIKESTESNPIILHFGTRPNKNLERTIMALKGCSFKLYIVGKLTELQYELLKTNKIEFKSFYNLSYEEVALLYHQCELVSFVSTYEGFGMPIIEAQLVGKPVITSDIEPMTWVAGDGACFVNPFNTESIRAGIQNVINDKKYRESLIEKGKINIERFNPEKITEMYIDIYKEVLN